MFTYNIGDPLLTVKNVSLSFGSVPILRDISFQIRDYMRPDTPDIKQGQVMAILGPSGIGKSELMKFVAGFENHAATVSGEILLGLEQIPTQAGYVGFVFQDYPLIRHRRVWGNLMKVARKTSKSEAEAKEQAEKLLERFQLKEQWNKFPRQLSGGQRQRAAIAQQLLSSDHFLIMDEPFSGLDPNAILEVCKLLWEVSESDELSTVLVITHDLVAAAMVADRIIMLGRDSGADGTKIPGAYIKKDYNLLDPSIDLAWHHDISLDPRFSDFVRVLRADYRDL